MTDIVERLQNVGNIAFEDINDAIAEITRLRAAAQQVRDMLGWHADDCADINDQSPDDATAHMNGICRQIIAAVLPSPPTQAIE